VATPDGRQPDREVAVDFDSTEEAELRVQLAALADRAQGLQEQLRRALQEQDSEDFALAQLLAAGSLRLTALEALRERLLVRDERGTITLAPCLSRHGPRKVAVVLTVTNDSGAPMALEARGLYNRVTLERVPFAARAGSEIAPGGRGRLGVVLDDVPVEGEPLTLELQVRRGAARTELPVELFAADFASTWWPF
jgi:hypothetical protein